MARRSEHSLEEIREMVLNAAETIVSAEGFAALKVRRIAMEIGYTIGTIYMVFENMDELIIHVKARTLDHLGAQLEQAVIGVDSGQTTLALAKAYLDFANNRYNLWSMVFAHQLSRGTKIPEWYQIKVDRLFTQVEDVLKGLEPGRPVDEVRLAARTLWCGIHGICILSLTGKLDAAKVEDVQKSIDLLVKSFIRGWQDSSYSQGM